MIKLFLSEDGSEEAERLFARLESTPPAVLHAPDLLYLECANVLWSRVKRRSLPAAAAEDAFAVLRELPLRVQPTSDIVGNALRFGLAHDISVYDACYTEVALRLDLPLVTADVKLVEKLKRAPVRVVSLFALT